MKRSFKRTFRHLFLPHTSNNQRAKILHHSSIFFLSLLIFIANIFLLKFRQAYPNILGSAINISVQELLNLTNVERAKQGLSPLTYNDQLAQAAKAKAQDMFTNDYWAHIDPKNGNTPWVFIQNAGYNYTYAGENLARGFSSAQDTINAWMASPTHRENVLSRNYQEVGFAVQDGNLTGEKDTTLIVEEFGGKSSAPLPEKAEAAPKLPVTSVSAQGQDTQVQYQSISTTPVIDRYAFAKNITQFLILLFIVIFTLDFIIIERRQIARLVGHNLDHILFLTSMLIIIGLLSAGALL